MPLVFTLVFRADAPATTRPRSSMKFQLVWPSTWKMSLRSSIGRPDWSEVCGSSDVRLYQ